MTPDDRSATPKSPASEARTAAAAPIETDALVIGAGPIGLFQVFELGLLEIGAQVIDALPAIGGQCIELYPDKPIYDIPGTPRCTGRELVARLTAQIAPFRAGFHLDEQVEAIERRDDGRFAVRGSRGTRFVASAIVIASGAGAFQPRRLKLAGIERFEGRQLSYRAKDVEPGSRVLVLGDEDAALEAAVRMADRSQVTLVHRRDEFRATPATLAAFRELRAAGRIGFLAGQPLGYVESADRLAGLRLLLADGTVREQPLDHLMVLTGLSPKLGPIADWGLALERKQLVVDPANFETSVPGIHAVGDAVTYRGKKRLIVCGFHEATLAAYAIAERVHPGESRPLEYTTTSPRLQRALGVAEPAPPAA